MDKSKKPALLDRPRGKGMKSMKKLNKIKVVTALTVAPLLSIFFYPVASSAAGSINQGATSTYAVLAGTASITNTGSTVISGTGGTDIGVSPGTSIGGGITGGTQHSNDASAIAAHAFLSTVFNDVNSLEGPYTTIPQELGGQTLIAGSYSASTSFLNDGGAGPLTFNAQGNPNAIFIMKTPSSTITTDLTSTMVLENGAQACNVYWAIGSSATLAGNSTSPNAGFVGHLYAAASITLNHGATVNGSLLAQTAITLDTNAIKNDNCAPAVVATPSAPQTSTITSVTPSNCVISGTTAVTLNGNFPTPVSNVTINGVAVAVGSWTQTATTVTVHAVTSSTIPTVIQIYNGQVPVLAAQSFTCTPVAVVIPTPTPTPT